jgi:16S rRNA (guanine966-N2)-methyltransferase
MTRKKPPAASRQANRFRIVAGRWRGRRLSFEPRPELRPTPDRVRETLFNWLAPTLPGARCLDLFAGSGALGLEALSRGAGHCVFVDNDPVACRMIRAHLDALACGAGEVLQADGRRYLAGPARPFDVVFLDPPFASGWLPELCTLLTSNGWLAPDARVYLEFPRGDEPEAGTGLVPLRRSKAGRVGYALLGADLR